MLHTNKIFVANPVNPVSVGDLRQNRNAGQMVSLEGNDHQEGQDGHHAGKPGGPGLDSRGPVGSA